MDQFVDQKRLHGREVVDQSRRSSSILSARTIFSSIPPNGLAELMGAGQFFMEIFAGEEVPWTLPV